MTWMLSCILKGAEEFTVLLGVEGSGEGDGHLIWSHAAVPIKCPASYTPQLARYPACKLCSALLFSSPRNAFLFFHESCGQPNFIN